VRRVTAGVGLLLVVFMFLFVLEPLPVHAASTLIQQNTSGCVCGGNPVVVAVTFSNNVAIGDVIVVGLAFEQFGAVTGLTDSLGSTFTQAVMATVNPGHVAAIYTATLLSSGPDQVTVTFSNSHQGGQLTTTYQVYIYEVAGVTTTGAPTAAGSGPSGSFSTSTTVSFPVGAFLLGVVYYSTPTPSGTTTAGAGFTLSPVTCPVFGCQTAAEYSDPVSSPTNFPASSSTQQTEWAEAGIALNPTQNLVTSVDAGSGSVSPNCPAPSGCSETVGSSQTVTATPSSGWQFSSWSTQTGVSCSSNPCVFAMPANNVVLGATFIQFPAVHATPVGGVMLPSVGLTVLLPWALLLSLLGVLSVEAFRVKRRANRR
jgi:hypothetical protein